MINTTRLGVLGKLGLLVCMILGIASCGFHLQGQSPRTFAAKINLYVDDDELASVITNKLALSQVELNVLDSVASVDNTLPTLQLTSTLKNTSKLTLDTNGDALVWRYTLTSQYLYRAAGNALDVQANTQLFAATGAMPISVSTDVDLSSGNSTVNERIKEDSWVLLYQQLGSSITRQLSFE